MSDSDSDNVKRSTLRHEAVKIHIRSRSGPLDHNTFEEQGSSNILAAKPDEGTTSPTPAQSQIFVPRLSGKACTTSRLSVQGLRRQVPTCIRDYFSNDIG
jgi:hypothetical protein